MGIYDSEIKRDADEIINLLKGIKPAKNVSNNHFQQIFYGAPGTGKSNKIKEDVDNKGAIHFRTTFHPDSDYSTFVGCYKPRSHKKDMLSGNNINETQLLNCFINSNGNEYKGKNKARYLYEALVHTKDIRDLGLDAQKVADKLNDKGFSGCAYTTEATCMYNIYDWLKEDGFIVENKMSYEFTPQAFVNAYVEAWKNQGEGIPVYLIIEEINRGNCAQIFGDLFQLLDRDDDGFSQYEISPDSDLMEYIAGCGLTVSGIKNSNGIDISKRISNGEILKIPNNLYIWATMNTSDQSLFPIDSAFKRRWDWVYTPIAQGKDKNGNLQKWQIEGLRENSWWTFVQGINEVIDTTTHSEDKKLGFFFCKAQNNEIKKETFVNKVVFYLWNDVFKVYGFKSEIFDKKDKNGNSEKITFKSFYNDDGSVNTDTMNAFVENVMAKAPKTKVDNGEPEVSEEQSEDSETQA